MKHQKVQLLHLVASGQPRPLVTANVDKMARSIKEVGLIQPIVVKPCAVAVRGLTEQGFQIVAGHHRVAAARSLGWTEIDAIVSEVAGHLDAELIEIDENLCRTELSSSQRSKYNARRKQIREAMFPAEKVETDTESLGICLSDGRKAGPQHAQGFVGETAAATGQSKSSIQKSLAVAAALGEQALDRVTGTSLDTGVELAALAKLGTEERATLIDRAQAGETVTARAPAAKPTKAAPVDEKQALRLALEASWQYLMTSTGCATPNALIERICDLWAPEDQDDLELYAVLEKFQAVGHLEPIG
jgi:hypothetical protein